MAGAQFTLHFPHQVAKFTPRANAFDQWEIALINLRPVDLRHIGRPEMIALEPPCFPKHLFPFALRVDRNLDPVQVNPTGPPPWSALTLRLFAGGNHTQAAATTI